MVSFVGLSVGVGTMASRLVDGYFSYVIKDRWVGQSV